MRGVRHGSTRSAGGNRLPEECHTALPLADGEFGHSHAALYQRESMGLYDERLSMADLHLDLSLDQRDVS